jgi:hypothetical protein
LNKQGESLKRILIDTMLSRVEIRERYSFQISADMALTGNSPASPGRTMMLRHLNGQPLSVRQAVTVQCFRCQGGYRDGKRDCERHTCHFYQWMPYGQMKYLRKERRGE